MATSRAYRRADSETQEAINSVLVLLPKCDSREPDVEDCRSACHQSCFRFSLSQNNDCKFSPAQAAFCTSSKTSPNNHLVKEKYTLSISKHELSQLMCVKGCLTYVSRNARLEQKRIAESVRNVDQTSKCTFEVSSKLRSTPFEVSSKLRSAPLKVSKKFVRNFFEVWSKHFES